MTIDWKKMPAGLRYFMKMKKSFVKTGEHLLIIDHTYVDAKWKGHAIGNALVQKVVDFAVADNRKIIPLCPFAKKVFDRTPEYEAVYSK